MSTRARVAGAWIVVATVVAAIVAGGAGGDPSLANLWVDLNGGTCTRQSSQAEYDNAAACGTLDAAWDAASSGDVIRVKAGTYPAQGVTGDKVSSTRIVGESGTVIGSDAVPQVTCRAVFGGDSAFCSDGAYLTLEDITIDSGDETGTGASTVIYDPHITWHDVNLDGQYTAMAVEGDDFEWHGGRHGGAGITTGPLTCTNGGSLQFWVYAPNTIVDGVEFRPRSIQDSPTPNVGSCGGDGIPHHETIRIEEDGNDLTIENSDFVEGSEIGSGHIFTSTQPSGLKLINNRFGEGSGTYAMQANLTCDGDTAFLYNTFESPVSLVCSDFLWVGNLGPESPGCDGTHTDNVWVDGDACGTDTFVGDLGLDSTGHLEVGSDAIDAAETPGASDYCTGVLVGSVDREGDHRPQGSACDAGSDER